MLQRPARRARPDRGRLAARAPIWRRWALGAAFLVAPAPPGALADPPQDATLVELRKEVERLRSALARFDERESGILGSLERLSMERLLLEEEIRRLAMERSGTQRAADEARGRTEGLRARLAEQRRSLAAMLRDAYKMGGLRPHRILLEVDDPNELARVLRYLSRWTQADVDRIQRFRQDAADLAATQGVLALRLEELERLRQEGADRGEDLERVRRARVDALRRVEEEREAGLEAVKELEEAAGRLETLVSSLPGGKRLPVDGRLVDLERFRNHLPWPVAGSVVVPFGTLRHPRFGTRIPHPGIEISVAEGTPVRPIFGGQVVFADWFRGYGNTVVVDHGRGTLSVYAHLRSVGVEVGDRVDPGTSVGRSGSTGSLHGPVLYLEIRHQGQAVDPLTWLRPGAAASS